MSVYFILLAELLADPRHNSGGSGGQWN